MEPQTIFTVEEVRSIQFAMVTMGFALGCIVCAIVLMAIKGGK